MSLPSRPGTPLASVAKRMLLAAGLLAVSALIVYLGRDGYRDAAHPGQPLSPLASVYYATVTLSTTGYGDIVPVSDFPGGGRKWLVRWSWSDPGQAARWSGR